MVGKQYYWEDNELVINLLVQPKASRDEWVGAHGDGFKVRITAPPVDGKANGHLIKFLANTFGVIKSHVKIESGNSSRFKQLRIQSPKKYPPDISAA